MKKFRKSLSLMLALMLVFTNLVFANANESEIVLDGETVSVLVYDGKPYNLNQEEHTKLHAIGLEQFVSEHLEINDNSIQPGMSVLRNQPGDINTYFESFGITELVDSKKVAVTPWAAGASTITYGESVTISASFSSSLSSLGKSAVLKRLGAGFVLSVSSSRNFSTTFPVPAGYSGRIMFTPTMRHTIGTYSYDSFTSWDVDAYIPRKVNGFADGEYTLQLR